MKSRNTNKDKVRDQVSSTREQRSINLYTTSPNIQLGPPSPPTNPINLPSFSTHFATQVVSASSPPTQFRSSATNPILAIRAASLVRSLASSARPSYSASATASVVSDTRWPTSKMASRRVNSPGGGRDDRGVVDEKGGKWRRRRLIRGG